MYIITYVLNFFLNIFKIRGVQPPPRNFSTQNSGGGVATPPPPTLAPCTQHYTTLHIKCITALDLIICKNSRDGTYTTSSIDCTPINTIIRFISNDFLDSHQIKPMFHKIETIKLTNACFSSTLIL